ALRPEPGALAVGAGLFGHVSLDPLPHPLRVGFLVAALEVVDDPLEAHCVGAAPAEAVLVAHLVALRSGAEEEGLALRVRQLGPGLLDVDPLRLGDRLDYPLPITGVAEAPGLKRALGQREGRVGDDQLGVDHALEAEPVAAL